MTALHAVAVHLPPSSVPIEQVGRRLGLPDRQTVLFRRFHGLDQVRLDPDGTVEDLLRAAAGALAALRGNEHRVAYVLYATSLPVQTPYPHNPLRTLCRELGLEHALAFKVSHHACASGLLAIDLAGRLLAAHGGATPAGEEPLALVLAGEKTFTRDAQIAPEISVFSEGAAACLVGPGGDRDRVLSYRAALRGEYDGRLSEDPALLTAFNRAYPELLEAVIREALDAAGTRLEEIKLIVPHNANRISWRSLSRRTGFPLERILLENVAPYGHCFAADAFINLHTATRQGLLRPGDRYLVAAAGIGAAFSAMVLEH
ncbi:3-oxoacyl-[acyl-carrier-protein] synthase III C-terminal domain-containing protein [Actinospica robiniae]|uniref:3-oxoacyl-[acyl-carrier-protein] synthase III C-terminal domain-containing protein n=1 Tax=Actinospica robiniae TaxID=304901 RepID=UPI0004090360|nr:3-oxoacyl-[acyl-carrier-protein] synthase III C-terminal domain-containing protein [Actinospica robiniae]